MFAESHIEYLRKLKKAGVSWWKLDLWPSYWNGTPSLALVFGTVYKSDDLSSVLKIKYKNVKSADF